MALCGENDICFSPGEHYIPVSSHFWFTAIEPAKVRCLSEVPPASLAAIGNCIGLAQAAILKRMELVERQGDQLELERLTRAKQIQDEITSDSIDQLTSVLKQGDPIPNSGDPLMTCLSCLSLIHI